MIAIAMQEIEHICSSDNLSLDALCEKINLLETEQSDVYQSSFFHMACMNKNITSEIITYLLQKFPSAASKTTDIFREVDGNTEAYPLHLCCYNEYCPSSVIKILIEEYPEALSVASLVEEGLNSGEYDSCYVDGLPIHYYLSRTSNLDIDTVKVLVDAYPNCLMNAGDEMECYPIHTILSNPNINNLQNILAYLIESEPSSIHLTEGWRRTPLHFACRHENITLEVFQNVLSIWPEAFYQRDISGCLPFHTLCGNEYLDEDTWFDIFNVMMNIDPSIVRERDDYGELPIHKVATARSPEVCTILINLYPESVREMSGDESLPIHMACAYGRADNVKYFLELYPESIHVRDSGGRLPFHNAAFIAYTGVVKGRKETIEFLLMHDPSAASKETTGRHDGQQLPLHLACGSCYADLGVAQVLFDAFPEAILAHDQNGKTPIDLTRGWVERNPVKSKNVVTFLQTQYDYTEKAKMTNLDKNGWLPLHHALKDKAPLGSIKLLVRGNSSAVRIADNNMAFPLHIACEFSSVKVVQYLVAKFGRSVDHCDDNSDSILHYACRGGNLGVVKYLLEDHAHLVSSATVNAKGELPIHLLCESGKEKEEDNECTKYIETIWMLLLANPEVVVA